MGIPKGMRNYDAFRRAAGHATELIAAALARKYGNGNIVNYLPDTGRLVYETTEGRRFIEPVEPFVAEFQKAQRRVA